MQLFFKINIWKIIISKKYVFSYPEKSSDRINTNLSYHKTPQTHIECN